MLCVLVSVSVQAGWLTNCTTATTWLGQKPLGLGPGGRVFGVWGHSEWGGVFAGGAVVADSAGGFRVFSLGCVVCAVGVVFLRMSVSFGGT